MAEGLSTSGSVTVEKVEIINVSGNAADVTQNTSYIEIFEDIQNPFLTGNISFNDPVNLKDLGPLVGQEILRLKLKTDSMEKDDEIIDSLFFMYDLANSTEVNQFSRQHQYKFCSIEALENNRTRISRHLRGTFSDMVKTILRNDLKCKKDIWVEESAGIHQTVGTEISPLGLIDKIKKQTISKSLNSPTYLFFETLNGFHFRSLENLYKGRIIQELLMHSEAGHAKDPKQHGFSDVIQELNTIRKLTCHTTVNNLNATSGGNYSSQVIEHDFFNKRVTHHHPYNYFDSFKNEKHINTFHGKEQAPFLSDVSVRGYKTRESDLNTKRYVCAASYSDENKKQDSHYTNVFGSSLNLTGYAPNSWLPKRTSWMQNFDGIAAEVVVDGNTALRSGDIVKIDLPPNALIRQEDKTRPDRVYNGPFLVRNIMHKFILGGQDNSHIMDMSCVKDCLETDMESVDFETVPLTHGKSRKQKPKDYILTT